MAKIKTPNAALFEKVAAIAAEKALEHLEKEKDKREKEKYDRRLRNIKLLLRNYRSFVKHSSDIKAEIEEIDSELELDKLDADEIALESIKRSKERTLALVNFMNKVLNVYKIICEQSYDLEKKRHYQVIHELYLSGEKTSIVDIAIRHSVHKRTVYKDIDRACETLAVLMFGVDGIKFR